MARYGLAYYNLAYYGPDNPVNFVAGTFTASPKGYSSIQLSWTSPSGNWSKIKLVRNPYGFPVNAFDGDTILQAFKETDPTAYLDTNGLEEGAFYYYSLFVFDVANYVWVRASNVIGLSVKDYQYRNKLYSYLPEILKVEQLYDASGNLNNQALFKFLSIFGFQLDQTHTLIYLIENRYDIEKVNGVLLPLFLNQFGLIYEPEIGLQQARILIRDAVEIGKKKGSQDGVREFIKAFTGYGVPQPITGTPNPSVDGLIMGKNLMLDYNDSSFEESKGHWVSTNSTATISSLVPKKVTQVSVAASVARLVVGTHEYKVNQKIVVSGCPYPVFNTLVGTPATITAVDANSIYVASGITTLSLRTAFNKNTESYTTVTPYPAPFDNFTLTSIPTGATSNKKQGILSVRRTTGTGDVTIECGEDNPILKGVPITSDTQYTFSVYASSSGSTRSVRLKLRWFNRLGEFISENVGSSTTTILETFSGIPARPNVTATAPSTAYFVVPAIQIVAATSGATEHHYFDAAQIEAAPTSSVFEEARQLNMTLKATRINELINPHFADPIAPWNITSGTGSISITAQEPNVDSYSLAYYTVNSNTVTIETNLSHDIQAGSNVVISGLGASYDGVFAVTTSGLNIGDPLQASKTFTYALTTSNVVRSEATGVAYRSGDSLKISATGSTVFLDSYTTSSDYMGIHYPNTSYSFSVYTQIEGGGQEEVTPEIIWYDITNSVISSTVGEEYIVTALGTSWQRISVTGTAPTNAAYASVRLTWQVIDGSTLIVDSALFENVGVILPYFDGNGGPCDSTDLFWETFESASRSHLYKNRFAAQSRLSDELIQGYLTLGTTFSVLLAQPNT